MNIPEEMLPKVIEINTGKGPVPRLPPMKYRGQLANAKPEEKARRYFDNAMRELAMAKYWMERTVE